jgi:hypothetical protein
VPLFSGPHLLLDHLAAALMHVAGAGFSVVASSGFRRFGGGRRFSRVGARRRWIPAGHQALERPG